MAEKKKKKGKKKNAQAKPKQQGKKLKQQKVKMEKIEDTILAGKQPGASFLLVGVNVLEIVTLGKKLKEVSDSLWSMVKSVAIGVLSPFVATDENLDKYRDECVIRTLLKWNKEELQESYEEMQSNRFDLLKSALRQQKPDPAYSNLFAMIREMVSLFAEKAGVKNYDRKMTERVINTRLTHFVVNHVFRIRKYSPSVKVDRLEIKTAMEPASEEKTETTEVEKTEEIHVEAEEKPEVVEEKNEKKSRRKKKEDETEEAMETSEVSS